MIIFLLKLPGVGDGNICIIDKINVGEYVDPSVNLKLNGRRGNLLQISIIKYPISSFKFPASSFNLRRLYMIIDSIVNEFRSIVGDEWFLDTPEDLAVYSYDGFLPEFEPDGVIVPENRDEISKIMMVANREKINIIPRGAGTNICGSSVAREGGIIIAFHRMSKILEIDPESMCAVVQPGVVNADLQKAVAGYGLMYPPDPASMFVSTIGGNVALNAGGPRGVKYGATKDYLLGLEVVLPSGEIIHTGGKALKSASGYDLTRLMCGSEGTLGILTEIIVRLIPLAPAKATLQAIYSDLDDAATTVSAIIGSGIVPTTLELIDRTVLDVISDYGGARFSKEAEALLLIEVDGEDVLVEAQGKRIEEFCRERGAVQVERASTPEEADKLWQARRTAFGAVASLRPNCIVEDATVPVKMLPAMIRKIVEITKKYDFKNRCPGPCRGWESSPPDHDRPSRQGRDGANR